MRKVAATAVLFLWSSAVFAHQDRIFTIEADGRIAGIPAPWGPVVLTLATSESGRITSVLLEGRRFRSQLKPCVLKHLGRATRVVASGSWWHTHSKMAPYVSLEFIQKEPASVDSVGDSVAVTISLESGEVLMGAWSQDSWWGKPRSRILQHAGSCSAWHSL